jgi:16S rRNA G527 N7-methylase RsmG
MKSSLSPEQSGNFQAYAHLLIEEGQRTNLTSLRDRKSIERRHFGESLALLAALEHAGTFIPAIDIGTGAAFRAAHQDRRLTFG